MKRLWAILFGVFLIGLVLAIAELLARPYLKKVYNRDFDASLILDNRFFTSPGLKPNSTGTVWGKSFSTDEFGCRKARKRNYSSGFKWLFIGDSVTEGVGVDDTSTFVPSQISGNDVYNYSLIGYSTADYVNVLNTLLPTDTTIGRVTIVYCLNDVYANTSKSNLPSISKPGLIGELNEWMQLHLASYKLLKWWWMGETDRYYRYDEQFYTKENPMFNKAMLDIKHCSKICNQRNIYFQLLVLPYRSQLTDIKRNEPQRLISQFCKQNDIKMYDATSWLASSPQPSKLYLYADEIHFSELGHRKVFEYIIHYLF